MRRAPFLLLLLLFPAPSPSRAQEADPAREILRLAGVSGGFIVHVGCGDGALTGALRGSEAFQVHGLDRDPANVDRARAALRTRGLYGPVSVDLLEGTRLPYVSRLVTLAVVSDPGAVSREELLRVLSPRGVALVRAGGGWTRLEKPVPPDIDDWTHYLHGPDGNPVAADTAIAPPRRLQWLGSPRWSRHHDRMASMSALVSDRGRLFYVMDEGSRTSILLPPKWTLIARDAFNGVVLWKLDLPDWQNHLWPLKSGPTQLARRLVAVGDRVYVTPGFQAPVSQLDAATGRVLRTYEGTRPTEELIVDRGRIFALVNEGESELLAFAPKLNTGDQKRVASEFVWNRKPRRIVALDAAGGRTLWSREHIVAPLSMASDGRRLFLHDGDRVVALDHDSGAPAWSEPAGTRPQTPFHQGVRLLLHDGVLLCKGTDRTLRAFDAATGKALWSHAAPPGGYQSPEDLLVVGGLVWTAPTTSTKDSGIFTGRDPRTGEVRKEFPPDERTYWFHHRCYIAKGSGRFLLTSRTGVEFVDPDKQDWTIHHWVRGGCLYGVLPANGMVYAPPHNCACYPEAKLYGFNAMAGPDPDLPAPVGAPAEGRLRKGPAYEAPRADADAPAWPTYRGDAARSGHTRAKLEGTPAPAWEARLGGRLSAATAAAGRVFVARVDEHEVLALDGATGKALWSWSTGGRVDSPPTYHRGRLYFGSADGRVTCLRASDGALAWSFRAAPSDLRHMAMEQLESVWPVHGSPLLVEDVVHVVAGRSVFLDGGLRYLRLDAASGRLLGELRMDDKDPETGKDLQDRIKTLQMPVGLADVLSSDGKQVFLRSQKFSLDGERLGLGPNSGDAAEQASVQKGSEAHVFAPFGFLDDSWFHRSYWVFGRSFAGGHNGYYQAGKVAPSGQILVHDEKTVYAYGRKPEYLKWTTTLEHQLSSVDKDAPVVRKGEGPQKARLPQHPEHNWARPSPIFARAMALADRTLLVAGPPDLVDEEKAFEGLAARDEATLKELARQDAAWTTGRGSKLLAVSAADGATLAELPLDAVPVWDGMAVADGRIYLPLSDGRLVCFAGR